uniref:von Willebrand factor A domain-containing protein 1 n=1 Tax=Gadus morhua TaxID=8049 RepID=A0A8C5CJQ3_GADMO
MLSNVVHFIIGFVATMKCFVFCLIFGAFLLLSSSAAPDTALNCREGALLLLLDSSGSVSSYEFQRLRLFLEELLRPFPLGPGHVQVGLLQVDTLPHLGFGLGAHRSQPELRAALMQARQLRGDTNTVAALALAKDLLSSARGAGGIPRVLLWLTDGVRPGDVDQWMSRLKDDGVTVLALATGQGDYQTLRRAVSPPVESHLYVVDVDDLRIVMEELREAIIEILCAEGLRVVHLTARSAVLQWRPVLTTDTGSYHLQWQCGGVPGSGSSSASGCGTTAGWPQGRSVSGGSNRAELSDLRPDATYTASLTPMSALYQDHFSTLSVTFTTLPELLGPSVVSVLAYGPHQMNVSWGPLQPGHVQGYRVEYAVLPGGHVSTVEVEGHRNSAVLAGLEPDTQYLVTVSALHTTGGERAMSVKACTQEVPAPLPALEELLLTPLDGAGVEARWRAPSGQPDSLRGYWLSWEAGTPAGAWTSMSYMQVGAGTLSAQLANVAGGGCARVCVSPVYRSGRGDGLCCTSGG